MLLINKRLALLLSGIPLCSQPNVALCVQGRGGGRRWGQATGRCQRRCRGCRRAAGRATCLLNKLCPPPPPPGRRTWPYSSPVPGRSRTRRACCAAAPPAARGAAGTAPGAPRRPPRCTGAAATCRRSAGGTGARGARGTRGAGVGYEQEAAGQAARRPGRGGQRGGTDLSAWWWMQGRSGAERPPGQARAALPWRPCSRDC